MKVLHIGLVSSFTEGMKYQENYLTDENLRAGHEVMFISNASKYINGILTETEEEDIILENGLRLVRLKYDFILCGFLTRKIQKVNRLLSYVEEFEPDAILYHVLCGFELMHVADYVRKNPKTLFYVDSHEFFDNTARTFIAKMAYKYIHGFFIHRAFSAIKKILYICEDSRLFLKEMYKIPDEKMELFPLGGIIQGKEQQTLAREKLLHSFSLDEYSTIFMHSGKMNPEKKTAELLRAFKNIDSNNSFLFIFGMVEEPYKDEIMTLIQNDQRVYFLGWKKGEEITELLCAADVYCQPGSPSATSQLALCCGCAEIVYPSLSYKALYGDSVLYAENEKSLLEQLKRLEDKGVLHENKEKAFLRAMSILNYTKIAERYLR